MKFRSPVWLLLPMIAGAALRLWVLAQTYGLWLLRVIEEEGYYEMGARWIDPRHPPTAMFRGPAYPGFVAAVESLFSQPAPGHVRAAQFVLSMLMIPAAYALGRRAVSPLAGLLAALWVALDPVSVEAMASLQMECFYSGLLLLIAWAGALSLEEEDGGAGPTLLLAFALGLSFLCRSTHFLLPPLLAVLFLVWRRFSRKAFLALLRLAALTAAFMLPWAARNAALTGKFYPMDINSGAVTLYCASLGEIETWTISRAIDSVERAHPGFTARFARGPALSQEGFAQILAYAKENIRRAPAAYAASSARRLFTFLGYFGWPALALAAFGLARRPRSPALWAVAAGFSAVCAYCLVGVQWRYSWAARPLLGVLCGCGLGSLVGAGPAPRLRWERGAALALAAPFALTYLWLGVIFASELREKLAGRSGAEPAPAVSLYLLKMDAKIDVDAGRRRPAPGRALWKKLAGVPRPGCEDARAVLRRDPDLLPALRAAASCERARGNNGAALVYADRLFELSPNASALRERAELETSLGMLARADADLEAAAREAPGDPEAAAARARLDAARRPREVPRAEPLIARAAARVRGGDLAGAQSDLEEAKRIGGQRPEIVVPLALVLRARGKDARALLAALWRPDDPVALTVYAIVRDDWKPRGDSRAGMFAAMSLDSGKACALEAGPLDRSTLDLAYFGMCLAIRPDDSRLYSDRGVALFVRGKREAAIADFRKALALDPRNAAAKASLEAALKR